MKDGIRVRKILIALQKSWSKETSFDRKNWTAENPSYGQCAVTALVTQDFFGGKIVRMDLSKSRLGELQAVKFHYLNEINGDPEDFTMGQFDELEYREIAALRQKGKYEEKTREFLFSNPDTKRRYKILRLTMAKALADDNPIFDNWIYELCLAYAVNSQCQKGKYGCVAFFNGQIIARAWNNPLEPLESWMQPECIRMKIPSRTESMIGCCGHAEEFALIQARNAGVDMSKIEFYVAGFRSNGLAYIKPEPEFTCLRCATQLYMHGVKTVWVPVKTGWAKLTIDETMASAKKFALKEKTLENFNF